VVTPQEWKDLIEEAEGWQPITVEAKTFHKSWDTSSRPVLLTCHDKQDYVVKGSQTGRSAFNEQVVARLGDKMGAPVATPAIVDIPEELIAINPDYMSHMRAGPAHGCRFILRLDARKGIEHAVARWNRRRFALLAVLLGWTSVAEHDYQFFYSEDSYHIVYSVDHGLSLPGGPDWTIVTLASGPPICPAPSLVKECGLTREEIREACKSLSCFTPRILATAIGLIPFSLGEVHIDERIALAEHLFRGCETLKAF